MTEMILPVNYDKLSTGKRKLVREEYVRRQGGKCQHCHELLSGPPATRVSRRRVDESLFPPNFFKFPVHLHHNRRTGMTIGAVHNKCNAVLWQYHGE